MILNTLDEEHARKRLHDNAYTRIKAVLHELSGCALIIVTE
jgi:hypothetical protein